MSQASRFRLTRGFGHLAQIEQRQGYLGRRMDLQEGFAIDTGKGGAQYFMPAYQIIEGTLQRFLVESSHQSRNRRHVVGAGPWLQLIEEPQSLLSKRERQRLLSTDRNERWDLPPRLRQTLLLHNLRQFCHLRALEE